MKTLTEKKESSAAGLWLRRVVKNGCPPCVKIGKLWTETGLALTDWQADALTAMLLEMFPQKGYYKVQD